jgi:hypothetical protein
MKHFDNKWIARQLTRARDIASGVSLLEIALAKSASQAQRRIFRDAFENASALVRQFEGMQREIQAGDKWAVVEQPTKNQGGVHRGAGEGDAGLYGEPLD